MQPAEIIQGMLDLLNAPEKWCKHYLYQDGPDGQKQHCLLGAMFEVGGYGNLAAQQVIRVMDELAIEKGYEVIRTWWKDQTVPPGNGDHLVNFNNAPETEYEDLRLFLKETLERVS